MKKKRCRFLSTMMAVMMAFTMVFASGVGQPVVKAEDITPQEISLSAYDIWEDGAKWTSVPTDGNSWNLGSNEIYDYETNKSSVDTSQLPEASVAGIKFGDNGSGSSFIYYETIAVLPAGTYALSAMFMGEKANLTLCVGDESTETAVAAAGWNNWVAANGTFTVAETQTDVKIGFYLNVDANGWGYIDQLYISGAPLSEESEEGYQLTISRDLDLVETGNTVTLTAKVTNNGQEITDLEAAGLHLYWWDNTNNSADWFVDYEGTNGYALTVKISPQAAGIFEIQAKLQDSAWQDLTIQKCNIRVTESSTTIKGDLDVVKVNNLPEDFIMGMDISSVIAEFESGVTFKDYNGNTIDNVTDFCKFLAENGITHIRVRVWNDPYNEQGNGYGGGNNDVAKAKQIADGCRAAGIKMLVDFHCSDLWTDPGKQMTPKAWNGYTVEQKAQSLSEFLSASLGTIDPNKDTVAMVQVGNETTGGFIGETSVANMCRLFSAGVDAVHAYNSSVKAVIHVTNPEKGNVTKWAKNLSDNNVNYDILATSYYPYWHGTLANLKSEFSTVRSTYGKEVMVAETSYAYTLNDTDGHDNTVRVGNNDTGGNCTEPFTVQGQATSIRNLINAVNEAGGLGVFYWEPAWITVGDTTGLTGGAYDTRVAENRAIWEQYGSGWASSYASEYDPDDAGKWYGGSAVDNEAMFYADGTPTAGLKVWNYVKTGAETDQVSVLGVENAEQTIFVGGTFAIPGTVRVTYNKEAVDEQVSWNASDIGAIRTANAGTYTVRGTVAFSKRIDDGEYAGMTSAAVTYTLTVKPANLITDASDAGFEKGTNFTVGGSGISAIPSKDDPYAGAGSMHWWSETASEGNVTYDPTIELGAGDYIFEAVAQGLAGDIVTLQILDAEDNVLFEGEGAVLNGWKNWQTPKVAFTLTEAAKIKLRIAVTMQAGGWGTVDELYLYQKVVQESGSDVNTGSSSGSQPTTPENVSVVVNPDGSTTETREKVEKNQAGNAVEITIVTEKDADGNVISVTETSVIANAADDTDATVTVVTNEQGAVAATADVTKAGVKTAAGNTKGTISSAVIKQIVEAAETNNVIIRQSVTNEDGSTRFIVEVNAQDLVAGETLKIVKVNPKTGEYYLCNAKDYKVSKAGGVSLTIKTAGSFVLLNAEDAKAVSDAILKTVQAKKPSTAVKKGKTATAALSTAFNKKNASRITYSTSNKAVATVNKNGKITAKKAGTVTIRIQVVLKNGETKTVEMIVTVK